MRLTTSLVGLLLAVSALGQNATNSTLEPEPTLEPTEQGETEPLQPLTPTEEPQLNATVPPIGPPEKLECYDNTTLLREHLALKNPFTPETYSLCSNTVFEIGSANEPGGLCCLDGQAPLHPRSNAKIQCGPDGNPDNNCTFVGGTFQILNVFTTFFDQPENAVIEGITFKESLLSAALLVNGGTVTFRNCIFEGHSNDGTIVSFHSAPGLNPPGRKLWDSMAGLSLEERVNWNIIEYSKLLRGEESAVDVVSDHDASAVVPHEYDHDEERQLQAGVVWELQEFVFENCIFQHNKQGDVGEFTKFGVVSVELEFDIGTFVNCTFYNNSHGNARGYAINFALGSKLTMINNCFIDNDFVGEGTVLLASAEDLIESSGNYGTEDNLLTCEFIHVGTRDEYECIEFEATECLSGYEHENETSEATVLRTLGLALLAALSSFLFCV